MMTPPIDVEETDEVWLALCQAKSAFIFNGVAPTPVIENSQMGYALYLINRAMDIYLKRAQPKEGTVEHNSRQAS